jgi:hypothetical protein
MQNRRLGPYLESINRVITPESPAWKMPELDSEPKAASPHTADAWIVEEDGRMPTEGRTDTALPPLRSRRRMRRPQHTPARPRGHLFWEWLP